MKEYIIKSDASGQRLDRYLLKLFPKAKKGDLQKWIRTKKIKVNNKKQEPNYRVVENDVILIFLPDILIEQIEKNKSINLNYVKLDIVYEDDDILIVNKPIGMLTHPDKNEFKNALSSKVQHYLKELNTSTFSVSSVNRLDVNTSGLILFCKNYRALKHYNELMRLNQIKKKYISIVYGNIEKEIVIEGYIIKNKFKNTVKLVKNEQKNSKYVKTIVRPIEFKNGFSKIEIELETGRTHQIRASLASIKKPIIGDIKYGGKVVFGLNHQLLIANILEFENKKFEIKNKEFENIWEKIETMKG